MRWSFFGFGATGPAPMSCELCGAEMVPERRRPLGMRAGLASRERRQHAAFAQSTTAPPAAPPAA